MLDKEIYGIIFALGLVLAIFFFGFYCINLNISNLRLRKKYKDAPDMKEYISSQTMKGLLMILFEILLCAVLLLVKKMFL